VDQAQAAVWDLEAVEAGIGAVCRTAEAGVGKDLAAQTAGSAHDPWRLANVWHLPSRCPMFTSTRSGFRD
jgi:hypothetical protein